MNKIIDVERKLGDNDTIKEAKQVLWVQVGIPM